ncbi:hypothetical protein [Leptospira kmetyi]|uniref:LysM domain-containing protein n=1 Tax=Leptospira kmetyi TaxID=408139 RepID=A0ABX4NAE4_9LEPT|nr:hypothetical protein [Leptospira kmetyi]PJZ29082.1 hypothetical protein CH378_14445 [Leptospira kmetyi]PJZ39751.1 hypothetical protein CH370_20070 [Leptospira kmetyi]
MGVLDVASSGINSVTSNAFSGSLSPTYVPQNVFSFSFYEKAKNGTYSHTNLNSNEYFFVNGPVSYTENFKNRTSIEKTFGGVVVIDYGPDNHEIKLEGEFHIYHLGLPGKPKSSIPGENGSGFVQSAFSAGKAILKNKVSSYYDKVRSGYLSLAGGDFRSGLGEFQDFMFLLHFARSLEKVEYGSTDPQASGIIKLFSEKRLTWKTHAFVFRDYDRGRTVEVVIPANGFTISRSVSDTNTYKYSLNLTVVKELESRITGQLVRSGFNPFRTISGLVNELENLVNLPLQLSGALLGVASGVKVFSSGVKRLSSSWERMENQFNAQGKLARKTFESAKEDLGQGQKRRGFHAEEISEKIDQANKKARSVEAEFRQNLDSSVTECQALISLIFQVLIAVDDTGSIEAMSLQPNADLSVWIDNDVYKFAFTANDILTETKAALNFASVDNEFSILVPSPGSTWESIANQFLGDLKLGQALARFNNVQDSSLPLKRAIRIPFGTHTNIFTTLPEDPSSKDLEIALLGCDIRLNANRGIEVSPTGDLAITEGDETLIHELLDLVDVPKGSLIQDLSLGNPIPLGVLSDEIVKNNYIQEILNQFKSNSRVKSAKFLGVIQDADGLFLNFTIESVSGGSVVISV